MPVALIDHVSGSSISVSDDASTPAIAMSQSNVLDLNLIDSDEFRAWFAPVFAKFLRANFSNQEHVAMAFRVRFSTACNWWNGDNKASGDVVMRAFMAFPNAVAWFLTEWAER